MTIEIHVPVLGESVSEATVGKWYKAVGDAVAIDEVICELETDKVALEVTASSAGVISEIIAAEGENIEVGALLGKIDETAHGVSSAPAASPAPAAKPAAAAKVVEKTGQSQMTIEVHVPVLGESVSEATVGKWYKAVGDAVAADEVICELETDKVALEVTASSAGAIAEIVAQEGDTVEVGALLAKIDASASGTASAPAASAPAAKVAEAAPAATPLKADGSNVKPAAAKLAAEKNVDLAKVSGTGAGGVITKADVLAHLSGGSAPVAAVASAAVAAPIVAAPQEEIVPMTRLRRTIAKRLKDAQNTAAMLTTYNEVDMTAVMELRKKYQETFEKKHGCRLGFMSFFAKACTAALKEIPEVNAEVREDSIVYKNYYNIGVAASTPAGLVVPVVRNCENLSFAEIEKEISRLGGRARDGKLGMDEMMGGTFTISNGGVFGSLLSSPILNAPQSGILGMHTIQKRPVVVNDEIVIRPMMYLSLSYDHRVVDGKGAVTFLVRVKENLEDPQRLVLDL